MKKITLLFGLMILVSTISVEANSTNKTNLKIGNYGRYHQRPVTFVERNVKFYIYQNGDLDFDVNYYRNGNYGASDNYYYYGNRKSNSRSRNTKKHHSNRHYGYHSGYIQYDYYGRVIRIGSTFIHYDYYGKVIAINSIRISYRHHRLYRVGNLRIIVDRYGHTRYIGSVKPRHYHYHSYYNDYFYDDYIYNYEDDFLVDNEEPASRERGGIPPGLMYEARETMVRDGFAHPQSNICVHANPYCEMYRPELHVNSPKGVYAIPPVGSQLWVFLYNGDPNYPVYFGSRVNMRENILMFNYEDGEHYESFDYPNSFENIR